MLERANGLHVARMEEQDPSDPQFPEATLEDDCVRKLYVRAKSIVGKYGRVLHSYPNPTSVTVWVQTDPVLLTIGGNEEAFVLKTTGGKWQPGKYDLSHLPKHFEDISVLKLIRYSCGGRTTFIKISKSGKLTTPLKGNNSHEKIKMTSNLLDSIELSLSKTQIPRVRTSRA